MSVRSPDLAARAVLGLGQEFTAGVVDEREVRLLENAAALFGPADNPLRARILARLAKALLFTPDVERRSVLSQEAVAQARRLGEPHALAAVLHDRHVAIWGLANAHERLAVATEVVQLAGALCHVPFEIFPALFFLECLGSLAGPSVLDNLALTELRHNLHHSRSSRRVDLTH